MITKDVVTIPRKEYEELLGFKKLIPIFKPTRADLKILARGRKNFKEGRYTEWQKVKDELAHLRHRPRKK